MFASDNFVRAGGLMSYGPNLRIVYARAAEYVDRLLNGAQPQDLPVGQPTKIELILNSRTAGALGLTFPLMLLTRADEVVE